MFNGRTYLGNEKIWLTTADLASSNLTFYYYHKDFLISESLMVPTIDRMGLYMDVNGNGRIDGWFNRETGYFVLDESSGDQFFAFLEEGKDYDESYFEPVMIDGQYRQLFLKVFYTKIPRALVPQAGQEAQRAQVLPAFISSITNANNYAELTEEQKAYRYIIAGQSRAYADISADRSNGDYACSADGLLMYSGAATRTEVLDIPLGGNTSPMELSADGKSYTWTPDYRGNLLIPFRNPEPIFIEHSLAGDNIPVAPFTGVAADGTAVYKSGGEEKVNGYLGSFSGNSSVALCIQEQSQTTAQIAAASGAGSLTARFRVCALLYFYITGEFSLELGTGATVEYLTETTETELWTQVKTEGGSSTEPVGGMPFEMKKDQSVIFPTEYKAFNVKFKGKLLVELFSDEACTKPVTELEGKEFDAGFIKSGGGDDVTVTMVQKDGYTLSSCCYVRLTALEDTTLHSVELVESAEKKSYWSGVEVSPSLFLEVGAGVGIEVAKFELYGNVGVTCALTLGAYNTDEKQYDPFEFNSFDFEFNLGFRLVLFLISYEMDMFGYRISYDGEDDRWWQGMVALGELKDNEKGEDTGWSRSRRASSGGSGVHVKLPVSTADTQEIYTNEGGGITPFAFDPTDRENVPFQLSGYGSSGDAFKLADGLTLGYDYQVVSAGGQNYVVYTISRADSGNLSPMDYTMLVLSRLRLTREDGADTYGLVNPVDPASGTPYILLDTTDGTADDGAGDLDFHVWVEDDTILHAAWVSYNAPNDPDASGDAQAIASAAARKTVVKTASFDTSQPGNGMTAAQTVSGSAGDTVFLPNVADKDVVIYGKANPFTQDELDAKVSEYAAYLAGEYDSTNKAEKSLWDFQLAYQKGLWEIYGKESKLCVAANGTQTEVQLSEGQVLENIEAARIGDTYYAA